MVEPEASAAPPRPPVRSLGLARALTLLPVVLSIPAGAVAVFALGVDRRAAADAVAWGYALGLTLTCTTAWWPLRSLRTWTRLERLRSASLWFLGISYVTHLTWELGWLLLHDRIALAPHAAWSYPWWAYIDGGDLRYATAPPELVGMELLSVGNGIAGVIAFGLWIRSSGRDARAVMVFAASATVHLYSACLYFLTEIIAGLPNVNTERGTDLWIKFVLANSPWIWMPPVVWAFCYRTLRARGPNDVGVEIPRARRIGG